MNLDAKIPEGDIRQKWSRYQADCHLVNSANKRKLDVIVIGSGLSGASAAATLAEAGYNVKCFCFQDSPRRAHSIAAQGGVNAAKNYKNDGDQIWRMFVDTLKGGDFRSREANVYRMAELSAPLIDHLVQQGVPFAREYGGVLSNRSFGGVQVQRTFYARGQTGQQLLLAAYSQLSRQIEHGQVKMFNRHEMEDIVVVDGKARGVVVRNLVSGEVSSHSANAVVLATGGYSKVFFLSTLAMGCNATAIWKAHQKGALFASPSFTQIHPTALPQISETQSKLTLMSESLRNDGRIWVPLDKDEKRLANDIPENERDYYLERLYPAFGNLAPRDISSRAAKARIDGGFGVGPLKNAVYLDFKDSLKRLGEKTIRDRYGNLFDMYKKITGIDAYKVPMMISPAPHFSMGGLWVDYELMTTIPGLYAIGECNFADHGANRLGANSLLQAAIDGLFILPITLGNYLSHELKTEKLDISHDAFKDAEDLVRSRVQKLLDNKGSVTVDSLHRQLGRIMWEACAVSRNRPSLEKAIAAIKELQQVFQKDVRVTGQSGDLNTELDKALRFADFLGLAELMCLDALQREESCGAHFREEHQTKEGEAERDDDKFAFVSAWEFKGIGQFELHREELKFEYLKPAARNYK